MALLLKSAKVIDSKSTYHGKNKDILIVGKKISEINDKIANGSHKIIDIENLHISPGWFDSSVSFGEPGFEERETLKNGCYTAGMSGFTDVLLNSNTNPVIDTKADISFMFGFRHVMWQREVNNFRSETSPLNIRAHFVDVLLSSFI